MRIFNHLRFVRARCLHAASRVRTDVRHRNEGLRRSTLYCVWKPDPMTRRPYAEWHADDSRNAGEQGSGSLSDGCDPAWNARCFGKFVRIAAMSTFVFGGGALLTGCGRGAQAIEPAPAFVRHGQLLQVPADSPLRKRLQIAPVELHTAPHWLQVPGTVEADPAHMANVLPPLGGRVTALHVDIGAHVKRGQLLAVLDSGDMAQAYADAAKARDALDLTRKTLVREQGVAKAGGAAVKDLEAARSGALQAEAEYRRAQARLAALGGTTSAAAPRPVEVRAPIDGVVTSLAIAPGMFVNDATAPIMTIVNIDKLWVVAQVPGNDLGQVATGQEAKVSVSAWPGRELHGTVQSINAVLDPDTRRDKVRIAIANADHTLKPNMFAEVALAVHQPPEVFVPAAALLMNNDSTTVFVEVAPWTFARRGVTLSYDEGSDARVLSGLKAGERVIVAGGVLLNDD